ncbi:MAG: cupin domain-containing protein [Frankiales bacterium]|nr:MAG: cupin domain-containing protein [Frankiales bacterium]
MEHFEIATVAEQSADFRRVLFTGEHTQLVIMTIPPGGEIGEEVHDENDQILSFVSGIGRAVVSGKERKIKAGDVVAVPAGLKHNFINEGPNPLVLYTVYGPPDHSAGAVHRTKEEADRLEEQGKDEPPQS